MTRDEALAILIHARHHAFVEGVLGHRSSNRKLDVQPQDDYRMAFRDLNRAYVSLRDGTACGIGRASHVLRRQRAQRRKPTSKPSKAVRAPETAT